MISQLTFSLLLEKPRVFHPSDPQVQACSRGPHPQDIEQALDYLLLKCGPSRACFLQ